VGRAVLPADTFASGPTSGQFIAGDMNGRTVPFFPIESILLLNPTTVLIVNDNNYPLRIYSEGRTPGQLDNSEFIQARLDISL
jgi:glycerophosphoryl diester phosphodiesterase